MKRSDLQIQGVGILQSSRDGSSTLEVTIYPQAFAWTPFWEPLRWIKTGSFYSENTARNWPSPGCLYSKEEPKSDTHLRLDHQGRAHTFYTATPSKPPRWLCRERNCPLGTDSYFPHNAHIETYKRPTGSKESNLPWCNFNKMPAFRLSYKPSFPEDRLLLFFIPMVLSSFQYTSLCNCLVT